jgi:hypothetical protein
MGRHPSQLSFAIVWHPAIKTLAHAAIRQFRHFVIGLSPRSKGVQGRFGLLQACGRLPGSEHRCQAGQDGQDSRSDGNKAGLKEGPHHATSGKSTV